MATLVSIWSFIAAHQTASALITFWLGSNFISALPSPNQQSGNGYKFFFSFMHGLAGSLPRLLPNLRLPGDPSRGTPAFFTPPPTDPPATKTP